MSQERVRDIIDHARDFYSQLGTYYAGLSTVADQERVKMLLNYLGDWEKKHEQALAEYEESASDGIMDTWFQCGADMMDSNCFTPAPLTPDMDIDTVMREVLRLEECLQKLYTEAINRSDTAQIKEVFTNLLEAKRRDIRNLVQAAQQLQDL